MSSTPYLFIFSFLIFCLKRKITINENMFLFSSFSRAIFSSIMCSFHFCVFQWHQKWSRHEVRQSRLRVSKQNRFLMLIHWFLSWRETTKRFDSVKLYIFKYLVSPYLVYALMMSTTSLKSFWRHIFLPWHKHLNCDCLFCETTFTQSLLAVFQFFSFHFANRKSDKVAKEKENEMRTTKWKC